MTVSYIAKLEAIRGAGFPMFANSVWDEMVAVVRAAGFVRHASDCAQVSWAHLVLNGKRSEDKPSCTCWRHDVENALAALEAKTESL